MGSDLKAREKATFMTKKQRCGAIFIKRLGKQVDYKQFKTSANDLLLNTEKHSPKLLRANTE
jgi:hypothetical protein